MRPQTVKSKDASVTVAAAIVQSARPLSSLWVLSWTTLFCVALSVVVSQFGFFIQHSSLGWLESAYFAGFAISIIVSAIVVKTARLHAHLSSDSTLGVQKIHTTPVPRIGGLAVFAGLAIPTVWLFVRSDNFTIVTGMKVVALSLPVFAVGLTEDLTKRVSVKARLVSAMCSGILVCLAFDTSIQHIGIDAVDPLFKWSPFAVLFTAFAIAGLTNSINIIDGLNGLASGVACIIAIAFAYIALQHNAPEIMALCLLLTAAIAGFWFLNFPIGKLFLGDGGAYLIGFVLAVVAVLLPNQAQEVDEWFVLSVLAYPVIEVIGSMIRRRLERRDMSQPDSGHLHQLVQQVISRWANRNGDKHIVVNSQATPVLWLFCVISVFAAFAADDMGVPAAGFVFSAVAYSGAYLVLRWRLRCNTKQ